ncbi:MAG: hypothetical protein LBR69_05980 [Endomicrobium sp.]|nr:hypothetical protein [Endomicrobium sp.]
MVQKFTTSGFGRLAVNFANMSTIMNVYRNGVPFPGGLVGGTDSLKSFASETWFGTIDDIQEYHKMYNSFAGTVDTVSMIFSLGNFGVGGQSLKSVGEAFVKNLGRNIAIVAGSTAVGSFAGGAIAYIASGGDLDAVKIGMITGGAIGFNLGLTHTLTPGSFAGFAWNSGQNVVLNTLRLGGRALSQSLNGFITYTAARNLYDGIKEGDVGSAIQSAYTLMMLNALLPIMSASSAIDKQAQAANAGGQGQEQTLGKAAGEAFTSTIKSLGNANVWKYGAAGGGIGFGGSLIYQLLDDQEGVDWTTVGLFTGAGFMLGLGAGSSGQYTKSTFGKLLEQAVAGSNPSQMFMKSFSMIQRIAVFNTQMVYGMGLAGSVFGKSFFGNGALKWVNDFTGFGFLEQAEALSISGFDQDSTNAVFGRNVDMLLSPQMWTFSMVTGIAQPLFGPALLHSPILGTGMQLLNAIGGLSFLKSDTLQMLYEEGFKENIAGAFGKILFGDSQAGEIFQELFDDTPDMMNDALSIAEQLGVSREDLRRAVNNISGTAGRVRYNSTNDTYTIGRGSPISANDFRTQIQSVVNSVTGGNDSVSAMIMQDIITAIKTEGNNSALLNSDRLESMLFGGTILSGLIKGGVLSSDVIVRNDATVETGEAYNGRYSYSSNIPQAIRDAIGLSTNGDKLSVHMTRGMSFAANINGIFGALGIMSANPNAGLSLDDLLSSKTIPTQAQLGNLNQNVLTNYALSLRDTRANRPTITEIATVTQNRIADITSMQARVQTRQARIQELQAKETITTEERAELDQLQKQNVEELAKLTSAMRYFDREIDYALATEQITKLQEKKETWTAQERADFEAAQDTQLRIGTLSTTQDAQSRALSLLSGQNGIKTKAAFVTDLRLLAKASGSNFDGLITDISNDISARRFEEVKTQLKEQADALHQELAGKTREQQNPVSARKLSVVRELIRIANSESITPEGFYSLMNNANIENVELKTLVNDLRTTAVSEMESQVRASNRISDRTKITKISELKTRIENLSVQQLLTVSQDLTQFVNSNIIEGSMIDRSVIEDYLRMSASGARDVVQNDSLYLEAVRVLADERSTMAERNAAQRIKNALDNYNINSEGNLPESLGIRVDDISNMFGRRISELETIENRKKLSDSEQTELDNMRQIIANAGLSNNTNEKMKSAVDAYNLALKAKSAFDAQDYSSYRRATRQIRSELMGQLRKLYDGAISEQDAIINNSDSSSADVKKAREAKRVHEKAINGLSKLSTEQLMTQFFTTSQSKLSPQASKEIMAKFKNGSYASADARKLIDSIIGSVEKDGPKNIAAAEHEIANLFKHYAQDYWHKFDAVIKEFMSSNDIRTSERLHQHLYAHSDQAAKLKQDMIAYAFNKTEGELGIDEYLAFMVKVAEMTSSVLTTTDGRFEPANTESMTREQLAKAYKDNIAKEVEKGAYDTKAKVGEGELPLTFGFGFLSANEAFGKSTAHQVVMLFENLLGRVSSLSAGYGKTFVYQWTYATLFKYGDGEKVGEFLGAKTGDAVQFGGNSEKIDNAIVLNMLGLEFVNGEQLYKDGKLDELASAYTAPKSEGTLGRIISYSIGQRGFVELAARNGEDRLNEALNHVGARFADEADVAALSRVSFILGSGNETVDNKKADKVVESLRTIQGLNAIANIEAKTRAELKGYQYTMIDGAVVLSVDLERAIKAAFGNAEDLKSIEEKSNISISHIVRAMYVMAQRANGSESVSFVNGQPASIEAGSRSSNTTDQSQSYNVALVQLEIDRVGIANARKLKLDTHKVKMSVSSGESTISQIFSRNQESTLNAGGSATLDVAKEVAHTIFGGEAVDIEASSMKQVEAQYNRDKNNPRFRVNNEGKVSTRGAIKDETVKRVRSFLEKGGVLDRNGNVKKDGKGANVGLLMGAMDMSYNTDIMITALAQLNGGNVEATIKDIKDATAGMQMTDILNYINQKYSSLQKYTRHIQIIDAVISETDPASISKMADRRGMLTFSNVNGLRGIDFKSIDMVIVDGHNFPSSELLQAIGRAGRNAGVWGKDSASVDVYMESSVVNDMLGDMKAQDAWFKAHGRRLFGNDMESANGTKLNDLLYQENLSESELLEIVSVYKSLQLKSESILFKAHQEAMGILLKEPLLAMSSKANQLGSVKDAQALHDLYIKAISNDESSIFADSASIDSREYTDPIAKMEETYKGMLVKAEAYLTQALKQTTNPLIRAEIEMRLSDISDMKATSFTSLKNDTAANTTDDGISYYSSTFAQVSRQAGGEFKPAREIAQTLVKLSSQLLPTKAGGSVTAQAQTVQNAIVTETMTVDQKAKAQAYQTELETNADYSYIDVNGDKVLTEKGKMFVALSKKAIMGDEDWTAFFAWLLGLFGFGFDASNASADSIAKLTDGLFKKGITDSSKITALSNMASLINKDVQITANDLTDIMTFDYPSGFNRFAGVHKQGAVPALTFALAQKGLLENAGGVDFAKVNSRYENVLAKFEQQQTNGIIADEKLRGKFSTLLLKGQMIIGNFGVGSDFKYVSNAMNSILAKIAGKPEGEIISLMSAAGTPITDSIRQSVKNFTAMRKDNKLSNTVLNGLRLSDISRFGQFEGILSLSDTAEYSESQIREKLGVKNFGEKFFAVNNEQKQGASILDKVSGLNKVMPMFGKLMPKSTGGKLAMGVGAAIGIGVGIASGAIAIPAIMTLPAILGLASSAVVPALIGAGAGIGIGKLAEKGVSSKKTRGGTQILADMAGVDITTLVDEKGDLRSGITLEEIRGLAQANLEAKSGKSDEGMTEDAAYSGDLASEMKLLFAVVYPTQDANELYGRYARLEASGFAGILTVEEFKDLRVDYTDGKASEGFVKAVNGKSGIDIMEYIDGMVFGEDMEEITSKVEEIREKGQFANSVIMDHISYLMSKGFTRGMSEKMIGAMVLDNGDTTKRYKEMFDRFEALRAHIEALGIDLKNMSFNISEFERGLSAIEISRGEAKDKLSREEARWLGQSLPAGDLSKLGFAVQFITLAKAQPALMNSVFNAMQTYKGAVETSDKEIGEARAAVDASKKEAEVTIPGIETELTSKKAELGLLYRYLSEDDTLTEEEKVRAEERLAALRAEHNIGDKEAALAKAKEERTENRRALREVVKPELAKAGEEISKAEKEYERAKKAYDRSVREANINAMVDFQIERERALASQRAAVRALTDLSEDAAEEDRMRLEGAKKTADREYNLVLSAISDRYQEYKNAIDSSAMDNANKARTIAQSSYEEKQKALVRANDEVRRSNESVKNAQQELKTATRLLSARGINGQIKEINKELKQLPKRFAAAEEALLKAEDVLKETEKKQAGLVDKARKGVVGSILNDKTGIYSAIGNLKYDDLLKSKISIDSIRTVLESAGLSIEDIKANNKKLSDWLNKSDIAREFPEIEFGFASTLSERADVKRVDEIVKGKDAQEAIKEMYRKMTMEQYSADAKKRPPVEKEGKFFRALGLNKGAIDAAEARIMTAINEVAAGYRGKGSGISFELLSDSSYVEGIEMAVKYKIIKPAEISSYTTVDAVKEKFRDVAVLKGRTDAELRAIAGYLGETVNSLLFRADGKDRNSAVLYDDARKSLKGIVSEAAYESMTAGEVFDIIPKSLEAQKWSVIGLQETFSADQKLQVKGLPKLADVVKFTKDNTRYGAISTGDAFDEVEAKVASEKLVDLGYSAKEAGTIVRNYGNKGNPEMTLAELASPKAYGERVGKLTRYNALNETINSNNDEATLLRTVGGERGYQRAQRRINALEEAGISTDKITLRELTAKKSNIDAVTSLVGILPQAQQEEIKSKTSISEALKYIKGNMTAGALVEKDGSLKARILMDMGYGKVQAKQAVKAYKALLKDSVETAKVKAADRTIPEILRYDAGKAVRSTEKKAKDMAVIIRGMQFSAANSESRENVLLSLELENEAVHSYVAGLVRSYEAPNLKDKEVRTNLALAYDIMRDYSASSESELRNQAAMKVLGQPVTSIIEGIKSQLGETATVGTKEILAAIDNCGVVALNEAAVKASSKTAIRLVRGIVLEEEREYVSEYDMRKAAANENGTEVYVGAIRSVGDLAIARVSGAESFSDKEIEEGIIVAEDVKDKVGHMETIKTREALEKRLGEGYLVLAKQGVIEGLAKQGKAEIVENAPSLEAKAKKNYEEVSDKISKALGVGEAGEKLVERMVNGFTSPKDISNFLKLAVYVFESEGAMREYIGLKKGVNYTKEEIAQAGYTTYMEALDLFAKGEMSQEAFNQEAGLIRMVSDIVIAGQENKEVIDMIDAKEVNISEVQTILEPSVKVNRNVFVDLGVTLKAEGASIEGFGFKVDFTIDVKALTAALNTKMTRAEKTRLIKESDLGGMPTMISRDERGKKKTILMDIRHARAVAQAA